MLEPKKSGDIIDFDYLGEYKEVPGGQPEQGNPSLRIKSQPNKSKNTSRDIAPDSQFLLEPIKSGDIIDFDYLGEYKEVPGGQPEQGNPSLRIHRKL